MADDVPGRATIDEREGGREGAVRWFQGMAVAGIFADVGARGAGVPPSRSLQGVSAHAENRWVVAVCKRVLAKRASPSEAAAKPEAALRSS